MVNLGLGDTFPNFPIKSTLGNMNLYDYFGDSWGILFSHPADFTPVCTTELAQLFKLSVSEEFKKRNCKIVALSCDSVESHLLWQEDIKLLALCNNYNNSPEFPFPIIADQNREISVELGMIDQNEKDSAGIPLSARAVFIVDPEKKMRLSILYPATTGRNFNEILRVLDSLQLCDQHKVATPADWVKGEPVMVQPSVTEEECKTLFQSIKVLQVRSNKPYLRETTIP